MKDIRTSSRVFQAIREIWRHLSDRRKKQFYLLAFLMLAGGVSESVSLGLVVPFLAALASPEKVLAHPWFYHTAGWLEEVGGYFQLELSLADLSPNQFLPAMAGLFVMSALLAGGIRLLLLWFSLRLANAAGIDLSLDIYQRTLYQPLSVHVARNSSSIVSNLTTKIPLVAISLSSFLNLLTSMTVAVFLTVALMAVSPGATLVAGLILGASYALITWINGKRLLRNSRIIAKDQDAVFKALQEGLGGIRDILLEGTQGVFCEAYRNAEAGLRKAHASIMFLGYSPRYLMESIGMVVFAFLAMVLGGGSGGLAEALPVLGALALGVQRLLPALQQVYVSWASLLAYQEPIREVTSLLNQPLPKWSVVTPDPLFTFKKEIRFESVGFRYSTGGPWILNDLSFHIPKGGRVGLVGKTGCGKSTCVDLLMGLLEPTRGTILIDGQKLDKGNLRSWQRLIAHVPQSVYLSDNSLAENIAFGVPPAEIDIGRVREAARQAQIADFIEGSPQGYHALVGERGVRLSGGQRQRIGIARALYKQAQVLVFDEATSALDHETELAVMRSINSLPIELTILIIAHRKTTLEKCVQIIDLLNYKTQGKVKPALV